MIKAFGMESGNCPGVIRPGKETGGQLQSKFLPACYGEHTGNAEEYFLRGPESSEAYGEFFHGSAVHAPAAQAEKFCRISRQISG